MFCECKEVLLNISKMDFDDHEQCNEVSMLSRENVAMLPCRRILKDVKQ